MKSIDGVPETITHDQILAACAALDVDPSLCRSIKLGTGYVEIQLHSRKPARIKPYTSDVAQHTIYYDVPDEPPGES